MRGRLMCEPVSVPKNGKGHRVVAPVFHDVR
jgi:hypothetical protein